MKFKPQDRCVFLLSLLLMISSASAEDLGYVQVRTAKLRSSAAPYASSVATLSYGDEVKKISGDDSWWNVRAKGGVTGFISAASVTDRKVILSSTGKVSGVGVDTADVVMAGKGFNKQIEESYARNGNLNYKAVNKLEAIRIGESDQLRFSQEGQLIGGK